MLRTVRTYRHYRGHRRIAGPALEPVSIADLKAQLRIDGTSEDAELSLYITAAREQIEELTGRALITQSWRLTLDQWPGSRRVWWDGVQQGAIGDIEGAHAFNAVQIPRYRLQAIDAIRVFNEDGAASAVSVSDFVVDTEQEPGRLVLRSGAVWPVALQTANAVEIDYTAGYGDTQADVPAGLRLAILQMAASAYQHRGDDCSMADAFRMSGAASMVQAYRVARL